MLPDDILLDIFDFYQREDQPTLGDFTKKPTWFTLVHVNRRWRNVVFASTRRLDLKLVCTTRTPVKKKLDIWPALPIVISQYDPGMAGVHNIISALKHNDRICGINLYSVSESVLEKIFAAMQQPIPTLKYLRLVPRPIRVGVLVIPDSFLGGSAPHLRSLQLDGVEFRGLSKLLSSTSGLVTLSLSNIHHFVSPDQHELQSASSQRPLPSTRFDFPALTRFEFKGYSQYLKDMIARVNAPILDDLSITLLYNSISRSSIPRLTPLISCPLNLKAPDDALIVFRHNILLVIFRSQTTTSSHEVLRLEIINACSVLSSLALVCGLSLPPLPTVKRLYLMFAPYHRRQVWDAKWLNLLYPFTALKELYLSEEVGPVSEGEIKVLPTLQNITSKSQLHEVIPTPYVPQKLFGYHILRGPYASDHPPMNDLHP
jgi:hypothetical protein